jgi:hypothetical protein
MKPLISAGEKAAWYERMALDPKVSPFALCVAIVIGSHIDRWESGAARVSRERIAADLGGASLRGVEKAIAVLKELNHLAIEKREVGFATGSDGKTRTVHGGRGGCNIYKMIPQTANGGSLLDDERANDGAPLDGEQRANGGSLLQKERANGDSTKSEPPFRKERTPVRTNLVLSKNSPSGGRRRVVKDAPPPPSTWVGGTDTRWLRLAERYEREKGVPARAIPISSHEGKGLMFPDEWLAQLDQVAA